MNRQLENNHHIYEVENDADVFSLILINFLLL